MRYLPFAVLAVAMIYTLVDCARADGGHVRTLPKAAWFVVILVLPVLGIVLWFLFGRPQAVAASAPAARPLSPDDDPRFLSDLAEQRRRERMAERRREAERAARDAQRPVDRSAEGDLPPQPRPTDVPHPDPRRGEQPDRNGRNPAQGSTGPEDAPST